MGVHYHNIPIIICVYSFQLDAETARFLAYACYTNSDGHITFHNRCMALFFLQGRSYLELQLFQMPRCGMPSYKLCCIVSRNLFQNMSDMNVELYVIIFIWVCI
jgi:hypothetical protein